MRCSPIVAMRVDTIAVREFSMTLGGGAARPPFGALADLIIRVNHPDSAYPHQSRANDDARRILMSAIGW